MRLVRGLLNLSSHLQSNYCGCVATIGNFDGVHLGHQAVIGQLTEKAAELGLPATVITFEPQPQEYFAHTDVPARLTKFREKLIALRRFALDYLLCLRFNRQFAHWTAEEFIQRVLVDGLAVKYLVIGDDFRFGHQRRGDFDTLVQVGSRYGFKVVTMHTFDIDGERVSSTRIREALARGDLAQAEKLLGRGFRLSGRVAHGDKRGRTIGFPTANVFLHRRQSPLSGVFAVEMFGLDREPVRGVANLGTRPTVDGSQPLLEVHLFDFDQDIYGRHVQVEFVKKLRDEQRFDSFEQLKQQIERDVERARACFRGSTAGDPAPVQTTRQS